MARVLAVDIQYIKVPYSVAFQFCRFLGLGLGFGLVVGLRSVLLLLYGSTFGLWFKL